MPSLQEARVHARDVFIRCQVAYRAWVNSGTAYVHREDEIYAAWKELAEIAAEYRTLANQIFGLQYQFAVAFMAIVPAIDNATENGFMPVGDIWEAWDAVEAYWTTAEKRNAPTLESIEELKRMVPPVTNEQIALMYGWKHEDGTADTDRVRVELAKPAEQRTTPENPNQTAHNQRFAEIVAKVEHVRSVRQSRITALTREAPEDLADLIRPQSMGGQGVSSSQIAAMKHLTVQQVNEAADRLGLPRPPVDYSNLMTAPIKHAVEHSPTPPPADWNESSEADDEGDAGDLVADNQAQEAQAYADQGYTREEIAGFMTIPVSEVAKLLPQPAAKPAAKTKAPSKAKAAK